MAKQYIYPIGKSQATFFDSIGGSRTSDCIDDPHGAPDDLSTYVRLIDNIGFPTDLTEQVELEDCSFTNSTGTVNYIVLRYRGWSDPRPIAQISCGIKSGATTSNDVLRNAGTVWTSYSKTYNTNPDTGGAWNATAINALKILPRIYVSSSLPSNSIARITQGYIEIDYTENLTAQAGALSLLLNIGTHAPYVPPSLEAQGVAVEMLVEIGTHSLEFGEVPGAYTHAQSFVFTLAVEKGFTVAQAHAAAFAFARLTEGSFEV